MVTQIKYLIFKGIEKKEQILFKSFLNLARNDLDFQVVVLKDQASSSDAPDVVIADASYEFSADEQDLSSLPTIFVGDEALDDRQDYMTRPVQWSDFRLAFTALDIAHVTNEPLEEVERVLPHEVKFAITEMGSNKPEDASVDEQPAGFSDEGEYDYELDHMSIDYHSFTNSDYMKVVDDVKQFKEGEAPAVGEAVILVTDDESASANSVLVIETSSHDAWEFSVSEISTDESSAVPPEPAAEAPKESSEVVLERKVGFDIAPLEPYWYEDNEIIADHQTVLFIKPEREMVYSTMEPAKWPRALQNKSLSKLPLDLNWKPHKGLKSYPLSRLFWVNTLINETEALHDDLPEDGDYILQRWPHFDLLELDNHLLKLCTMLFVGAESVHSLASKSGYGRSTVRGLMNACYREGILKPAADVDLEELTHASNDESMFGKIKDVFR